MGQYWYITDLTWMIRISSIGKLGESLGDSFEELARSIMEPKDRESPVAVRVVLRGPIANENSKRYHVT